MRILFLLLFISLVTQPVIIKAQTVKEMQTEMQQEIKDVKVQIADMEKDIATAKANKEDPETIKEMEDELIKLKKQLSVLENTLKNLGKMPSTVQKQFDEDNDTNDGSPSKIPPEKKALLAALPKNNFSKPELSSYLITLHNNLKKKIPVAKVTEVQKIITQLENDASKIAFSGVAAWYNKAPSAAVLLMTYAASKSPDNDNTLNNCAAILNLCGLEEKAIPILKYILVKHPDNSTVLNNLGQAYTGLGDKKTAMTYLISCIRKSPTHPEANATAAKIEESNGNKEKALEYTVQSLKGAYSQERAEFFNNASTALIERVNGNISKAMEYAEQPMYVSYSSERGDYFTNATTSFIDDADYNEKAIDYTETVIRETDSEKRTDFSGISQNGCKINILFDVKSFSKHQYFDIASLSIPPNCRNWEECETVYPAQQAFKEKIETLTKKFEKIAQQNLGVQNFNNWGKSPFEAAALFKKGVIGDCYVERVFELANELQEKLAKFTEQIKTEQIALFEKYDKLRNSCPENGKAACLDKLMYQECLEKKQLDNKYFAGLSDIGDEFRKKSYTEDVGHYNSMVYLEAMSSPSDQYLTGISAAYTGSLLNKFSTYVISSQCYPDYKPDCAQYDPAKKSNPGSPDFKDPQCPINITVPFGVGEVSLNCKSFGIEVGQGVKFGYEKNFITRESTLSMGVGIDTDIPGIAEAKAVEKVYVKFDKDNQPVDVGLSVEASVGIKGQPPIVGAGYTIGVNSGFNYSGTSPF